MQATRKNKPERDFQSMMEAKNWTVTKQGWPDFICYRDNHLILVEVKKHRGRRLKKEQRKLMVALARRGIKCYRWTARENIFDQVLPGDPDILTPKTSRLDNT